MEEGPAHTAIRQILQGLSANEVERVFREHAAKMNCAPEGASPRVVAFDGKTLKGSFVNFTDVKAKQMLSAFAVDTWLVLAHAEIEEKSNEIHAMQNCWRELGLSGYIATPDAIHCKKNFRGRRRMHLIVQLNEKHPNLCDKAEALRAAAKPLSSVKTFDAKRQSRQEIRIIAVFDAATAVKDTERETHLSAIIHVEREVATRQADTGLRKASRETSYYLSNSPVTAKIACGAIRMHWWIENTSHHTRHVTLREDASRIRENPGIFDRMRSLAHNIYYATSPTLSLKTVSRPPSVASKRGSI